MPVLSAAASHEYYFELGSSLPPTPAHNREDHERRMTTAVDAFNALNPADAYEGRLAVQAVLCGAHAADSLREAGLRQDDFAKMTRCRAQAASMMRETRAAKRMLAQEQKLRLAVAAVAGSAPVQPAAASASTRPAEPQTTPPQPTRAAATPPQSAPGPQPVPPRRLATEDAAPPPEAAGTALRPAPEARVNPDSPAIDPLVAAAVIRNDRGAAPNTKAALRASAFPTHPTVLDALLRGAGAGPNPADKAGRSLLDKAA